ncbi:MAG: class II aldolase/adducin family protein [Acidibacillus sp.]|nr:class II aldolase/adducin family protein [Acidibacillus sp.]
MFTLAAADRSMIDTVIDFAQRMVKDRLVTGTSGNISCLLQSGSHIAITPTGVPYHELTVDKMSVVHLSGDHCRGLFPSSETPMHLGIYQGRKDVQAVVHTHSMYATTFAVLGEPIPALHYMIAALGGNEIPVTSHYAQYGTLELAQSAVSAMGDVFSGVLLRNHGAITVGTSVAKAYQHAILVEEMAELYYRTRCIGDPKLLTDQQMNDVFDGFKTYGKQNEPIPS